MADRTITSADSSFFLGSSDYGLGIQLEGYAADAAFAMDNADTAETSLGVDGKLSAGWVPRSYMQTITLQADSPSASVLDLLIAAQDVARTVFRLTGTITMPGNKSTYSLLRGVIKNYTAMPGAQRVLQPRTYVIEWERILSIPIG
jgi:hypothetical protein